MHFRPLFFVFKVADDETCQVCYHGTRFFKLQLVLKLIRRMCICTYVLCYVCYKIYLHISYPNFCQSSARLLAEFLFNWHVAQGNVSITGSD